MLCLSHVYVSEKVMGRKSNLLLFGSVLPDICTTSQGELSRDEIHYAPLVFFDFVQKNYPDLKDLSLGVRLHSHIGHGADYYSDNGEIGFAIVEGKKLNSEVARLLGIEIGQASLVFAHNLIEAAVDANLKEDYPQLLIDYRECLNAGQNIEVIECLTQYLHKDKTVIETELKRFTQILNPAFWTSPGAMVEGIFASFIKLKWKKEVNLDELLALLLTAKEMMKNSYQNYLDQTVAKMKIDFAELI